MDNNIIFEQLKEFSKNDTEAVRSLVSQLGHANKFLTDDDMREILNSSTTNILAARDTVSNKIIAMITVSVYRIPYIKKAYLDDFVVDESHRGKGIGSKLFEHALALAREKGAFYVDFTSRPEKIQGNRFYEKLGFKKRDTNVYRLNFDYGEK